MLSVATEVCRSKCPVCGCLSLSEQGHHALRPGDSRPLSGSRHCCYPVLPAQASVPNTTLLLLLSTWWPSQVSHSVIIMERPRRRTLVIRFECIVQEAFKYLFAFYSQIPMCLLPAHVENRFNIFMPEGVSVTKRYRTCQIFPVWDVEVDSFAVLL